MKSDMTLQQLLAQLAVLSTEELRGANRFICEEFRRRQSQKAAIAKAAFSVGQEVSFIGKGVAYLGTITKINRKTIEVKVPHSRLGFVNWKVSPQLLKTVTRSKVA